MSIFVSLSAKSCDGGGKIVEHASLEFHQFCRSQEDRMVLWWGTPSRDQCAVRCPFFCRHDRGGDRD
jgi:hypothetical protein